MAEMSSEVSSASGSLPPAESSREGLEAYDQFYLWITSSEVQQALSASDSEMVQDLPRPGRTIPLRVLASLGNDARSGSLEFHYNAPGSHAALRDWYDANRERIWELVLILDGASIWRYWRPPEISSEGSVEIVWDELVDVAQRFGVDRSPGVTSVALVFLRDWAFRFFELWPSHPFDDVLADLLSRVRGGAPSRCCACGSTNAAASPPSRCFRPAPASR